MSEFQQKVIDIVKMIPYGKVASYGQIALYCGMPRAAREVGWTLRQTKVDMPWWRVVNNAGKISIEGNMEADKNLQRKLLESEGIGVADDFTFPIEKFRWIMPEEEVNKLQLPKELVERIISQLNVNNLRLRKSRRVVGVPRSGIKQNPLRSV